jgi:hypothetical protein
MDTKELWGLTIQRNGIERPAIRLEKAAALGMTRHALPIRASPSVGIMFFGGLGRVGDLGQGNWEEMADSGF